MRGRTHTGTVSHVSEGTTLSSDSTWAFVPGVPTSPVDSYGNSEDYLDGQLNLTPPFSAIFTIGYQTDGPYSLPLQEDQDCPDNTPPGSS